MDENNGTQTIDILSDAVSILSTNDEFTSTIGVFGVFVLFIVGKVLKSYSKKRKSPTRETKPQPKTLASFTKAFNKFKGMEFSSAEDVLHKNSGEGGLTFYGIYQSAHKSWDGWDNIESYLNTHNGDIRRASIMASQDKLLLQQVRSFYYTMFWRSIRLDELRSQQIAEELFFFYLHTGDKSKVVKFAQDIVGEDVDGIIGNRTINALNRFDENVFDVEYDKKQEAHYRSLAKRNPQRFSRFLKGWLNRARKV